MTFYDNLRVFRWKKNYFFCLKIYAFLRVIKCKLKKHKITRNYNIKKLLFIFLFFYKNHVKARNYELFFPKSRNYV